ncbi:MAG: hypothetical protein J6C26_08670 [Clostridia bacterium]|nr:hypothetical protein [Clostridia bacterium]
MKKTCTVIALALALALLVSFAVLSSGAASESSKWDGTSVSTSLQTDPSGAYLIQSAADLAYFVKSVNDQGNYYVGKTVKLTKDIVWNEGDASSWKKDTVGLNAWSPIGPWGKHFQGVFDGQGHTVSGLFSADASNAGNVGFFGVLWGGTTTIKNLNIVNSAFLSSKTNVGGVAGVVRGNKTTIENIYVDAHVEGSGNVGGIVGALWNNENGNLTIKNCVANGIVKATGNYGGGIVGMQGSGTTVLTVSDCLNLAEVTANSYAGGINGGFVWTTRGQTLTVTDCIGLGLVADIRTDADTDSAIFGNYADNPTLTNLLYATDSEQGPAGGKATLAGCTGNTVATINVMTTEALATAGFENWGLTAEGVLPKAVAEMLGLEVIVEKPAGSDTSSDSSSDTTDSFSDTTDSSSDTTDSSTDTGSSDTTDTENLPANPVVKPNISDASVYDGTKSTTLRTEGKNVYTDSAADLAYFASRVTSGDGYAGKTVILTTDIVWNKGDADSWTATSTGLNVWSCGAWNKFFRGTFDGQGHTVSGLYQVSDKDNIGFINGVGGTCEIKNLVIVNSAFFCTRDGSSANLGGVVGVMGEATKLKIDNVYCDANLIAPKAIQVGGIIGRVHNGLCTVDITNTVFAGTVEGARMVGGIIGNSDINNNKDGVSTTLNISNTLMIGSVKGNSATAGIVGRSENGQTVLTNVIVAGSVTSDKGAAFLGDGKVNVTLKNCYYAEEMAKMASAVGEVTGGTVVKASELTNKAVFDGWTKLNGTYPMPGSVAKMVNLSGNGDTSDFSAVSAIVIAMIALVASAAVVLSAKKRNA